MEHLVVAWYGWLSSLTQGFVLAVEGWLGRIQFPAITALGFGLIGATAPCQLTTNLGALAYVSARVGGGRSMTLAAAYVAGKVTVYTVVGALVVLAGSDSTRCRSPSW